MPVNANFWYPADGATDDLPVLHLLNGFNVYNQGYTTLSRLLAEKGYLLVAIDYQQPSNVTSLWPQRPECLQGTLDVSVAGLVNGAWQYLFGPDAPEKPDDLAAASASAANNSAVLLGHSAGGTAAFDIFFGACDSHKSLPSASPPSDPPLADTCEGYQPITDPATGRSIIRGVVGFEGYDPRLPQPLFIPPGTFLTQIASQFRTRELVNWTYRGNASTCATYAQLNHTNHYMLADFDEQGSHQASFRSPPSPFYCCC